jgi:cell division septation protein DedD
MYPAADKFPILNKQRFSQRTVNITVSLSTLLSSLIVLCAGFVVVFALGILLGRGYNVEAHIPQLERIMPRAERAEQPAVISHSEPPAGPSREQAAKKTEAESTQGAAPGSTAQPSGNVRDGAGDSRAAAKQPGPPADAHNQVMQQGELAYRDNLKQQPGALTQKKVSPERQGDKTDGKPAPQSGKSPSGNTATQQTAFNYVYQVAAYKDAAPSDKLVARLKAGGIKARTEMAQEGGTVWYRTMVDFRGSPDDTDGLKEKLGALGLTRLLLKSKTQAE